MTLLLDTNVVIALLKDNPLGVRRRFRRPVPWRAGGPSRSHRSSYSSFGMASLAAHVRTRTPNACVRFPGLTLQDWASPRAS